MKKIKFSFLLLSSNFPFKSVSYKVPVWLPMQVPPAVTEIIASMVCRPNARWAVCCHPVDYLPAYSFQNDQTIAKLFASCLPDHAFVFVRFH